MKNSYTYEYKGHVVKLSARANGYYGWIDGKPFTKGNLKSSKAGDNPTHARRAVENQIDLKAIEFLPSFEQ